MIDFVGINSPRGHHWSGGGPSSPNFLPNKDIEIRGVFSVSFSKSNIILPSGSTFSNWGISCSSVNTDWGNTDVSESKFPDSSSFVKYVCETPADE